MAMVAQETNADDGEVRPPEARPDVQTPGALLLAARERAGLTREKVAARLNLLLSQVVALEEDRFDRFPAETFVKGHLRSYARLVKIDADAVLRAYYLLRPPVAEEPQKATFHCRPQALNERPSRWRGYAGVGAVCLVLVALWSWQQRRDEAQLMTLNVTGGELPGGIESALYGGTEATLLDSVQLVSNNAAAPAVTPPPVAERASTAPAAEPGTAMTAPAPAAAATDRLSLRFSADCWIEVKDRDDRVLVATLKHAHEQLQIEGRGPFKVLLGNAPGVEMAYNGAPVKVDAPPVGNRSTRLIVGNS